MPNIQWSPRHGVNPYLDLCFWCGKPKGVLTAGRLPGDEAAQACATNYEPCADCAALRAKGHAVIEVNGDPSVEGQLPIEEGLYPTGYWFVAKSPPPHGLIPQIHGLYYITPYAWDALEIPREDVG